jgi:anti-sigma regulatory factor (Ser/Thr protein kinase)
MATVSDGQSRSPGKGPAGANKALAAALRDAGCSYASLALRVNEPGHRQGTDSNYDKASVTRRLNGQQQRGNTPELIAAVLSERLGRAVSPSGLGFLPDQQRPVVGRTLVYREDLADTLHTLAELGSTDISRRSLLGAAPFVAGALTNPQREWLLWLVENLLVENLVENQDAARLAPVADGGPVEQVHAMISTFDQMDNHDGGGGVRTSIVHYLSTEVVPMLQRRGTPPHQQRPLYAAVARLAAMAGWSSYDAGEYGLAQRYMTQALRTVRRGPRPCPGRPDPGRPLPSGHQPRPPGRGSGAGEGRHRHREGLGQPARPDAPVRHVGARTRDAGSHDLVAESPCAAGDQHTLAAQAGPAVGAVLALRLPALAHVAHAIEHTCHTATRLQPDKPLTPLADPRVRPVGCVSSHRDRPSPALHEGGTMTASRAHRGQPPPSLTLGADRDAPTARAWSGEAVPAAPAVPVASAVPAVPAVPAAPAVAAASLGPVAPVAVGESRRTVVPARPSCASVVRRVIAEQLAHLRLPAEQLDNAVLATDELFANAVKHGGTGPGDTVTVTVECAAQQVRVTVADRSPGLPRFRTVDVAEESGRGLAIVAALVDDWGTAPPDPGEVGKRVWFTVKLRGV